MQLINEAASSDIVSTGTQMKYEVEIVNVDVDNDFFEIGFVDGMVCCTGTVQGLSFDHAVSTSITENDINSIIGPALRWSASSGATLAAQRRQGQASPMLKATPTMPKRLHGRFKATSPQALATVRSAPMQAATERR